MTAAASEHELGRADSTFGAEVAQPSIALVHGAWADGSGYRDVYDQLTSKGFTVRVVQNPTTSLDDDLTVTRNQLDQMDGPVVLVGHSWGGFCVTGAGTHDKVAALVYLTAFAPDEGESELDLIQSFPQDGPQPPILPAVNGFVLLDHDKFVPDFAPDVEPATAAFLADSQIPFGVPALTAPMSTPAWKTKPAWYLHVTDDKMINPEGQLTMAKRMGATIVSVPGDHAIYISNPAACVEIILKAVEAIS